MTNDQFEKLAQMMKEMHDDLSERVDAVHNDLSVRMEEGFASIRAELREINRRLDALEERVQMQAGYAKEIDELRSRVITLEKQVKTLAA